MASFPLLSPHSTSHFASGNMDFSYFNPAPQPYQYFSVPHTTAAPTQPMDMDNYVTAPQPHQPQQAPHYNSPYAAFPDAFHYDQSPFLHPAAVQSQLPSRAPSRSIVHAPSISPGIPSFESVPMSTTESMAPDEMFPHRSSSEERDNMTPQQSKRKAQNRAAQRAFRERKEQHVKNLETQVDSLQQRLMGQSSEMERLQKELKRFVTENEKLRANSSAQPALGEDEDTFEPLGYASTELATNKETAARRAQMLGSIHTIVIDDNSGELLLNSGQTWDYIQRHESFRKGLVDVGDVIDRLKQLARSDGHGPVFRESDIRHTISESAVAGGRDELL